MSFTDNPVLHKTASHLEKLKHALALDVISDSASDSDSSSESSDAGNSSDMEAAACHIKPEMVDMNEMPLLLRRFDRDIIEELRERFEIEPFGYLTNILDFISQKSQETDTGEKYKKILKLIAEYKKIKRETGHQHKIHPLIESIAVLANAKRKQAFAFLEVENNSINDHIFHITNEEWEYFIETGKAWDEAQHSRTKRRKISKTVSQ